jgi:uncharacterized protein YutE (UPF0331/DUF86 family)
VEERRGAAGSSEIISSPGSSARGATEYDGIVKGLAARGVVSAALGKQLQGLGGFRNILVHGYLGIDPDLSTSRHVDEAATYSAEEATS